MIWGGRWALEGYVVGLRCLDEMLGSHYYVGV